MPSSSTADPSDRRPCAKDSASKSEAGDGFVPQILENRSQIWRWRAEPRDLVPFSTTVLLTSPLGPPLRSQFWREIRDHRAADRIARSGSIAFFDSHHASHGKPSVARKRTTKAGRAYG
jgi:hypothetical protein